MFCFTRHRELHFIIFISRIYITNVYFNMMDTPWKPLPWVAVQSAHLRLRNQHSPPHKES
jgi:hypothetical protein